MRAMNEARKIIENDPESKEAKTLGELVLALESGSGFTITKIYDLDYKAFELALAIISGWRLERHYSKKFRLIDMAVHAEEIRPHFGR